MAKWLVSHLRISEIRGGGAFSLSARSEFLFAKRHHEFARLGGVASPGAAQIISERFILEALLAPTNAVAVAERSATLGDRLFLQIT